MSRKAKIGRVLAARGRLDNPLIVQRAGGQGEAGAGAGAGGGAGAMAVGAWRGAGFGFCCRGGGWRRAAGAGAPDCNSTKTGLGTRRGGTVGSASGTTFTGTVCGW